MRLNHLLFSLLALGLLFSASHASGQASKPSGPHSSAGKTLRPSALQHAPLLGVLGTGNQSFDYEPVLRSVSIEHGNDEKLGTVPLGQLPAKDVVDGAGTGGPQARALQEVNVLSSFGAFNRYNGFVPMDNDIAVSNKGMIVSASNTSFAIMDLKGTPLFLGVYSSFFRSQFPSLTGTFYDPRVSYDETADRFVMVVLHGSNSALSKVMVMFSKTNNPLDGWNIYALDGDVGGKGLWFDYPHLAVNEREVYITGNLFTNSNTFREAVLLQIEKNTGYNGSELNYQYWNGIEDEKGIGAFGLVPIPYGMKGSYGPGIFLMGQASSFGTYATIYDLTNYMSSDDESITPFDVKYSFTYSAPTTAKMQSSGKRLDCGDSRIQGGFYLNGNIHYTFSTRDNTGFTSVIYAKLTVSTGAVGAQTFGLTSTDYAYPNIAFAGQNETDGDVFLCFLRSSSTLYPGVRAVYVGSDFSFSESAEIKEGSGPINILALNEERWGDYTGIARKFNSNACVMVGAYGNNDTRWASQIGIISIDPALSLAEADAKVPVTVFPVPVRDYFSIDFTLKEATMLTIELVGADGKTHQILLRDQVYPGLQQFQFNRAALSPGTYLLRISSPTAVLAAKKVVVE